MKNIKKTISIIMVLTILLALFTFNVSAASVSVSGGTYEVGKTFSVAIKFNADDTLYVVDAKITYNTSVLRLNSVDGADFTDNNGTIKIYDEAFKPEKPTKTSSYTLNFTAIAAGNSPIKVDVVGGGEADSYASASTPITVITPKPSSNANLTSIKLSNGSLSPAFNANTTNYSATVKYSVDSITITGAVADGGASYTGGGTFALQVGDNSRTLTVTAADGTKKSYTVNIKRMTEQETAEAEQAARDANPLLVIINDIDYTIVNNFEGIVIPAGFTQGTAARKESEITVLNDDNGKYQLCYLTDANGENGAFYSRDEEDNFKKLVYVNANGKMYIVEDFGDYGILPADFKLSKCTLDGVDVDAIVYMDETLKDFYVLNCYVGGNIGYYRIDIVEGTMQRAVDFESALTVANTEPEQPEPTGPFAWFTAMTQMGKIVFVVIVAAALMLVALAVILIVKIVSSNGEGQFNDEINSNANEFILNDFADDVSDFEPQSNEIEEIFEASNKE